MEKPRKVLRGELALVFAVIINSFGVVLMLQSQSGISAISSVPYAFSEVLPQLSLGTWTYIFQGLLIASLFILRRKIVPEYLLSFAVGFCFGIFVDLHESWVQLLPQSLPLDVLYFAVSYLLIAFGIALSNRCRMPITPTDLFPRELAAITKARYSRIKIAFDVICLLVTVCLTFICLGRIMGLGASTVIAALTMGKAIGIIGEALDRHVAFVSVFDHSGRNHA